MTLAHISDYTHDAPQRQQPDTQPGLYYVSVRHHDTGTHALACGPFADDHAAALAAVPRVRDAARASGNETTRRLGVWAAWGTARLPHTYPDPPTLNTHLQEGTTDAH